MAGRRAFRGDRERGVSTVEVVILAPVVFLFSLTMVGLAFYAQNVSQVQEAANDTARMASLQSSSNTVTNATDQAATADLRNTCNDGSGGQPLQIKIKPHATTVTNSQGTRVAMLEATVTCKITEFGISYTVVKSVYAPVDTYGGQQP